MITSASSYIRANGQASTFVFTASGGGTLTWSIVSGSFPSGMNFNTATGALTGSTSTSGTFPVTVRVTNVAGSTTQKLHPHDGRRPGAAAHLAADQRRDRPGLLDQRHGHCRRGAITYAVTVGSLPPGIALGASSGTLTGTPTAPGVYNFTVTATNTFGVSTYAYQLTIADVPVLATSIQSGAQLYGNTYTASTFVSGSSTGLHFSVSSGSLPSGLSLNTSTGVISGQATALNLTPSPFTIQASNSAGTVSMQYSIAVGPAPDPYTQNASIYGVNGPDQVSLNDPNAFVGWNDIYGAYGISPVTWAITAGTLPPGMSLDPNAGTITGTPTSSGTYTYDMTETNPFGSTTVSGAQIQVIQPLTYPSSVPDGLVNQPYSFDFLGAISGGFQPDGASDDPYGSTPLPSWLTYDNTYGDPTYGYLVGTPTTPGTYTFDMHVYDQNNDYYPVYTITIGEAPDYTGVPTTLSSGDTINPYSDSVAVSNGYPTPTYAVTSGNLPPGLTVDPNTGAVTGTATAGGTYNFTVTATNQFGTASAQFTTTITSAPAFTGTTLPGGGVGTPYSQPLPVTGSGPITFSLNGGQIPPGLTLNPSTGVISGTPTLPATTT